MVSGAPLALESLDSTGISVASPARTTLWSSRTITSSWGGAGSWVTSSVPRTAGETPLETV